MGQYYFPICLTSFEWLYSHDYGDGLKLMEHSYIGNSFVSRIMKLLTKGGKWYKGRIVWVGDYSEKVYKESNLSHFCDDDEKDRAEISLFNKIKPKLRLKENEELKSLIINHTKKEYVKVSECKKDENEWVINPLPLLTALGNGMGGGDYNGSSMDLIGRWAFDEISVEFDEEEFKDFTKITPNFQEGEKFEFHEDKTDNETIAYKNIKKWFNTDEVKKRLVIGELR